MINIQTLKVEPPIVYVKFDNFMDSIEELNQFLANIQVSGVTPNAESLHETAIYNGSTLRYIVPPRRKNQFVEYLKTQGLFKILTELLGLDTRGRWMTKPETLYRNCKVEASPVIDVPGYSIPWHVDNRTVVVQGVINLKDNQAGTEFCHKLEYIEDGRLKIRSGLPTLTAPRGQGEGIFWLNTENSGHRLTDISERRHIMLCSINLFDTDL